MKYLITQDRKDAIGIVQEELLRRLDYKEISIKWVKFMPLSHLWEFIYTILISFKLKKDDIVLSCNSKSVHTHILPYFTKAKIYQYHFHFDDRVFGFHRLPFFSYEKLFSQVHTIFATEHMKDIAVEKYGCKNWSVVHAGIDHNIFRPLICSRVPSSILYVGSFGHRKNIHRLLRAFGKVAKQIPEASLTICNGSMGSYDMIEPTLEAENIKDRVTYFSNTSLDNLILQYNRAEVFAFPTLVEGFGLPLVEAMACGCKVVTSNRPVHKEVTKNAETYVNPEDVNDIAKGLLTSLSKNSSNRKIAREFDWDSSAKLMNEIIK